MGSFMAGGEMPRPAGENTKFFIAVGIAIAVLAIAVFSYLKLFTAPKIEPIAPVAKERSSPETEASLGANIYTEANNPIKDKIPESQSPAVNPIEGVYQNPFE